MTAFLFHEGAGAICTHGGQVSTLSSNKQVLVNGMAVVVQSDISQVAGCAFTVPPNQPCVTVPWLTPAVKVFINGQPAILQSSSGICQSAEQIPQGQPMIISTQTRVSGT
ncbi:PAAR-like protein [Paenibacillus alvei]|uniref:DUF4280 domain-containing protein n=1 Tax=Paenibacillus alvei TaxID=44250 RepID=A0A383RB30_PAEAL|nr:PAAR-like protein [Paenibacillus alvei]SYX84003.1 conserved protein of unknown function [Paenibacillus alvei]